MCRNAKGAVVIGLSGWVAVRNLNDSAYQHQRNANCSEQRCPGELQAGPWRGMRHLLDYRLGEIHNTIRTFVRYKSIRLGI